MIQGLYDWTMRLAAHRHALWALAMISFIESSVFPIPPDILLIPMVLAARDQAFRIAAVCTVASVLGGLGGYGIGYFLYESIGQPLIAFYGYADKFSAFQGYYHEWGAWIVGGAGLTPFPYKVITIASGVTALDPVVFTVASVVSRGIRFFLVAWLLWRFGAPIRVFIEKNLGILATVFFVLLLGSFVLVRYVF
ncbi:MAG: DedA family protein [Rhodospirillaceae bacterium]|nr:DedA family protein [Rhodospirillaceae bacterium]MBT4219073.1 DedA family protein [Rhodospirillaceae bacterium]MBT4463965.1 DedA family protein [Rhodospirillaceae bacterium]MBT5013136.1 DedA family protein [Rhodospirillaceae bacterium]MBT5307931.1 DedA family protein [Rhodospirillaceae bacterium]